MPAAPTARSSRTAQTGTSTDRRGGNPQEVAARRAQKLAEVHAQLADAVAAAATDAGWRAWLSAAAKFRSYRAGSSGISDRLE